MKAKSKRTDDESMDLNNEIMRINRMVNNINLRRKKIEKDLPLFHVLKEMRPSHHHVMLPRMSASTIRCLCGAVAEVLWTHNLPTEHREKLGQSLQTPRSSLCEVTSKRFTPQALREKTRVLQQMGGAS